MLNVNQLSISFHTRNGVTQAVKDVSFSVKLGQTLAIVGESGSGKSVSCQTIMGLIPCPPGKIDSGSIVFNEQELLALNEKQLRAIRGKKIGMIFQDPMTSLNPFLSIETQLTEVLKQHNKLSKTEAKLRAIKALEEVGIPQAETRLSSYPHEFSGGMRQRVMIAMTLATNPELIIADEPTTALDVTVQAQIMELLAQLQKKHNLSIIFISHDLGLVKNIADHVIVMKTGEVVEEGHPEKLFTHPEHPYTQNLIKAIPNSAKTADSTKTDENIIEIKALTTRFTTTKGPMWNRKQLTVVAADNINLEVKQGEILGLVGESGSGKSTLGRSIVRLNQPKSGEIIYKGKNLLSLPKQSMQELRSDIQMIFQDPYASLNPRMTIFQTLKEPALRLTTHSAKEMPDYVAQLLTDVGLPSSAMNKYPHEFSGGQRQRVAIARALSSKPKFIIADEPVSALDVTIQDQILNLLLDLSKKHKLSMLFISHDLAVVRYICDRVAVMKSGRIVELGETESIFASPQNGYTKTLLNAIPKFDNEQSIAMPPSQESSQTRSVY